MKMFNPTPMPITHRWRTRLAGSFKVFTMLFLLLFICTRSGAQTLDKFWQYQNLDKQWVTGNIGPSNSEYYEGQALPYRIKLDNLQGGTSYTLILHYDVLKGGKFALDFLTTYNYTSGTPNPFAEYGQSETPDGFIPTTKPYSGVTPGANQSAVIAAWGKLTSNQKRIALWNAQPYSGAAGPAFEYVSEAPLTGFYPNASDEATTWKIRFTATANGSVYIAFGAHISSRYDYGALSPGVLSTAVAIPGSPYHHAFDFFQNLAGTDNYANGSRDLSSKINGLRLPECLTTGGDRNLIFVNDLGTGGANSCWGSSNTFSINPLFTPLNTTWTITEGANLVTGSLSGSTITLTNTTDKQLCGNVTLQATLDYGANTTPAGPRICTYSFYVGGPAPAFTGTLPANITVDCNNVPAPVSLDYSNGGSGLCLVSGSVMATRTGTYTSCGGTLTDTWTTASTCGNAPITYSRTITVNPAPAPAFTGTLPGDITIDCGTTITSSSLNYTNGQTGTCAISGSVTSTLSELPGKCGGKVTETWTIPGTCGRADVVHSRVITVSPAAPAVFTDAPATTTVDCNSVPVVPTIHYTNSASGSCLISGSVTATRSGTYTSCGGTLTDSWTYTDDCGRTINGSRTITVNPAPAPAFTGTLPGDITVDCGGATTHTLAYSNGQTGTCAITGTVTSTLSAIPNACGGPVTETWTVAGTCGRPDLVYSRTITVRPAALPTLTAPANITVDCGAVPAVSTISFSNGLSGGCLINGTSNTSTMTATPGVCGGTITETWTAKDACGRDLAPVSRTITVRPAALPTMTAPAAITVPCGGIPAASKLSFSNGLTGGCAISGQSNLSTFSATPSACGGDVTETWTATDECGRALASVSRVIHVSPAALPTMTAPANITVDCGAVPAATTLNFSNGLTDGCLISGISNASTKTATPGVCGGTITETWTATDKCGRALASVSRTITVRPAPAPAFTGTLPGDITVDCGGATTHTLSYSNGQTGGCEISGTVTSTLSAIPNACGGTVTETWTIPAMCDRAAVTYSRTITVRPAALPTMTAPAAITVPCGGIPAASKLSFSNGLTGGCAISGQSNLSTFSATPSACGGDVTETWTATDNCGRALASVSRVIHVSPATLPTMTAPADITVACGGIPAASRLNFSNGLTGGCAITGQSNLSTFSATPSACGGNVTETWTATDECGRALASVSRVIHVSPAALPTMTAPENITVDCGAVPATSTLSFSNGLSGGCLINGTSNTSTMTATPGACGGTITETWTAKDACGRDLAPVSRTITVRPAALPTMTAPENITVDCGNVPAAAAISFSNGLTGGCAITGTSNMPTRTATPGACGGTITETWTATDKCGRALASVSRTITVNPTAEATWINAPGNTTGTACTVPEPSTLSYSNGQTGACGISGSVTSTISGEGNCGTFVETWTFTDDCGRTITHRRNIEVACCNTYCTYTQGYFGNTGGMACDGDGNTYSTYETITHSINAQSGKTGGGMIRIGVNETGKGSFTITAGANADASKSNASADVKKVVSVLPGGGAAKELTHTTSMPISQITNAYLKNGRINNNLLSQTITLAINVGIKQKLAEQKLEGGYLVTAAPLGGCGSTDPIRRICHYDEYGNLISVENEYKYTAIDGAVVAAINADPKKRTVAGLLQLANAALSNVDGTPGSERGVSLSAIQSVVDAINNAYDGCMVTMGFNIPRCSPTNVDARLTQASTAAPTKEVATMLVDKLTVTAYPNPFTDVVKFTIASPVSGQAQLEVYNMMGQKVNVVYNGFIEANKAQVVEYHVGTAAQQNLIYMLNIGGQRVTGKLLNVRK